MTKARKKWLWTGGCGAALFCAGLCGVVESAFLKHGGAEPLYWVAAGTLALTVLMLGLVLLLKSSKLEDDPKKQ